MYFFSRTSNSIGSRHTIDKYIVAQRRLLPASDTMIIESCGSKSDDKLMIITTNSNHNIVFIPPFDYYTEFVIPSTNSGSSNPNQRIAKVSGLLNSLLFMITESNELYILPFKDLDRFGTLQKAIGYLFFESTQQQILNSITSRLPVRITKIKKNIMLKKMKLNLKKELII